MAVGCPWVLLLSPNSLANLCSKSGDQEGFLEELTRGSMFITNFPDLTGVRPFCLE
jgi:hypothetical protein